MKKTNTIFTLLLLLSTFLSLNAQLTSKEKLEQHVYTLAADSMFGRKAGTEYAVKSSEYIVNQWNGIGIKPYFESGFLQSFENNKYHNIVGIIPGNDSVLKKEYLIIGAHYDHIGERNGQIYNGADDNASGVATLIELGRALKNEQLQLKRSVILIAFDAEELGLLGSTHFIQNIDFPIENIKLMMSVDMVGWYKASGKLIYAGSGTIKNGKNIIENPSYIPNGLNVVTKSFEKSIFTATDTQPFAEKGIPTLAVTTGTESPYHKPEDDAHLIDYDGLVLINEHLKNILKVFSADTDVVASGKIAKKHRPMQLFSFAVTGQIGSNYHYYTEGALNGKSMTSSGVGLTTQMNFRSFAIRPEVFYERINAKFPGGNIYTDNVTIPLSIVLQSRNRSSGADLFFGGYYSYRFSGKQGENNLDFENTFKRNEFGLTYGFGVCLSPFKIGFTNRTALTSFTKFPNSDNAYIKNRAKYLSIAYIF